MSNNTWHHVVATFENGVGSKAYLDGTIDGTLNFTDTLRAMPLSHTLVAIGRHPVNSDYHFLGNIDEVAIWKVLLTADDVDKIYNEGTPTDLMDASSYDSGDLTGNLLGYWRFEENTGVTVADSSANDNEGTIAADATWSSAVPS